MEEDRETSIEFGSMKLINNLGFQWQQKSDFRGLKMSKRENELGQIFQ